MATLNNPRKILATGALPYANGSVHIGHMVEYTQADIWTRFQKMRGHDCIYICADDTHGTPIMIKARELGIRPEDFVAQSQKEHMQDFADFEIEFDHYSSTNSEENKILCEEIFLSLKKNGLISVRTIDQLFSEQDKMFLPDRFIKGTCPKCGEPDQYGDACDKCGATYSPTDMKDPRSAVTGAPLVLKPSEHIFFTLNKMREFLLNWIPKHTDSEVSNKQMEWFKEELRDWDISRDAPYFGFEIPGHPNKYFYVWVDAPIGYISSSWQWMKKHGRKLEDYWKSTDAEIYHFIGKDITYFHTLFWPAMLEGAGFRTPTRVCVHGHLTVNGEKMSKSKGTSITARTYLNHMSPSYLRYYYACKLGHTPDDLDLSMDDFVSRVNSDLIGKITNLGSRGAQMLTKKMDGMMSKALSPDGQKLVALAQSKSEVIAAHYEARDFAKAINEIRALADECNRYFDEKAPWKSLEADLEGTREVLTTTLNIFRILAIYLKPVLPSYVAKVEKLYGDKPYAWADAMTAKLGTKVNDYEHLATRIDPENIKKMIEASKVIEAAKVKTAPAKPEAKKMDTPAAATPGTISFDDFAKVDLRIVKIIEAEEIKEADKLLRLKVDLGEGQTKQIIAGIKSAYKAEDLVGRLTVIVANLEPRKMKFGMSEGMVLAAGAGGSDLFIMSPDTGAKPGQKVK